LKRVKEGEEGEDMTGVPGYRYTITTQEKDRKKEPTIDVFIGS